MIKVDNFNVDTFIVGNNYQNLILLIAYYKILYNIMINQHKSIIH